MFNSPVLDFFIALLFVYFLLSLLSSALLELFITVRKWRGKMLEKALTKAFDDKKGQNWCSHLYAHPLIEGLRRDSKKLPAYIPGDLLADALIDMFVQWAKEPSIVTDANGNQAIVEQNISDYAPKKVYELFVQSVDSLPYSEVRELLQSFITNSSDLDSLKNQITTWFKGLNDRMGGWFKTRTRIWLQYTAFAVAVIFNLNFIEISRYIWQNDTARQSLVEQAIATAESSEVSDFENLFGCDTLSNDSLRNKCSRKILSFVDSVKNELREQEIPVFWRTGEDVLRDSIDNIVKARLAKLNFPEPEDCQYKCDDFSGRQKCKDNCEKLNKTLKEKKAFYEKVYTYQVSKDLAGTSPSRWQIFLKNLADFWSNFWEYLLGWTITAFLVSQGAPFWFKLITRLINVRGDGGYSDSKTKNG